MGAIGQFYFMTPIFKEYFAYLSFHNTEKEKHYLIFYRSMRKIETDQSYSKI